MTSDKKNRINHNPNRGDRETRHTAEAHKLIIGAMDMLKRDRFELLSAYLDGEVTAAERRQVETWLEHDPETQRLYERLLNLRQGFRTLPVPTEKPVEPTIQQVYQRIHRRAQRRALVWGGSAIAAVFVGAIATLPNSPIAQIARFTKIEPLMVALNDPVVEIPRVIIPPPATEKQHNQPVEPTHPQNKNFN
jgi:anti-sigma-K factor RskA